MEFCPGTLDAHVACLALIARSPEHFGTNPPLAQIKSDLESGDLYTACEGARILAFSVVSEPRRHIAEILWMVVEPQMRRRGIGTGMLRYVQAHLTTKGCALLLVKTLAPTSPYEPYNGTRRFYERHGFLLVDVIDPYPGWSPGNPCAIYVKPLDPGRENGDAGVGCRGRHG